MMLPIPFGSGLPDASFAVTATVPHQHPPHVRISTACPHRWRIVPVGAGLRWFTNLGLTTRLHTQDRDFDARWSVETDDVEFGEALFRHPEARSAVAALEEMGACWITQTGKHLTAVLGTAEKARLKEPTRKAAVEAALKLLAEQGAALLGTRHFPQRRGRTRLLVSLVAGAAALFVAAIVLCVHWSSELVDGEAGMLALRSLLAGLPIGLAALAAATVPLAGRSTSHKDFGVLALMLLPAVTLACFAGALAANRFLDLGPAIQQRVPVLELQQRRNEKKVTGYWAVVPAWHTSEQVRVNATGHAEAAAQDGRTRRISFGTRTGSKLVPGRSELLLVVSPGRLGAERLLQTVVQTPPER